MNLDFFRNRATVRVFSDREMPDSLVYEIIEAAAHAPNTGNMQLYSVVVTKSEEGRRKLAPLHFNQPAATGAPVLLTVCADIRRFGKWCDCRQAKTGLDNFGGWLSAITDAAIFAQQIVTAAEANGLGCCYLGTATYNIDGFAEALGKSGLDEIVLAEIYPAREVNTYGISSEKLCEKVAEYGMKCKAIDSFEKIAEYLKGNLGKDEAVFVVGAGDVNKISQMIVK